MPDYLEFEVEVVDLEPRVWRRLLLSADATFMDLHEAIQDAGPWEDYHLWEFYDIKGGRQGPGIAAHPGNTEGFLGAPDVPAADTVRLADVFKRKGKLVLYTYDMGDDWNHLIIFEGKKKLDETFKRRLLGGERSFPPEDCGGVPGYYHCLVALGEIEYDGPPQYKPSKADLRERKSWLGGWKPDAFKLKAAAKAFDR